MKQDNTYIFKPEEIDWKQLEELGIQKEILEKDGNLDSLLQGKNTDVIPLKIQTGILLLTIDATLKLVEAADGKPVMEINGLESEPES